MTSLKNYIPLYVSLFLKFFYDVSTKQVINIYKMKDNKKCTAQIKLLARLFCSSTALNCANKKKNKQNLTQIYALSLTQEKHPAHLVNLLYFSYNTKIAMQGRLSNALYISPRLSVPDTHKYKQNARSLREKQL